MLAKCAEEVNKRPSCLVPNMVVSLHDGVLVYIDIEQKKTCTNPVDSDFLYFVNKKGENFQQLLAALYSVITRGRSTDVFTFVKYIIDDSNYPGNVIVFKL